MKRIIAMILAAMMLCCVLVACDNGGDEAGTGRPSRETTAEQTTEEKTTEEETTPEETTDDGLPDLTDVYVDVWDDLNTTQTAQQINEKHKGVGVAVTIPEGGYLYELSVLVASWGDSIGNLTVKIFAWNTDFETTVAAEHVYAEEFVDFQDNGNLVCEFDEGEIPAGRYLILVCDGVDASGTGVGVWLDKPFKSTTMPEEYAKYEIESFINGKSNKKTIGKFSLTITELEEE